MWIVISYFDSIGAEHIPKVIKKFIGSKNVRTNIYIIQAYNSIMFGYYCIKFIDFMLKDKSLIDYTYLISPNNTKIFSITKRLRWKSYIPLFAVSIENLKSLKYNTSWKNISSFYYLQ